MIINIHVVMIIMGYTKKNHYDVASQRAEHSSLQERRFEGAVEAIPIARAHEPPVWVKGGG